MNDNIDKNEIRRAIDRLQIEHPCNIAYDPAAFVNMEAVNTIKGCIDQLAKRMAEDTEINIICEFAKLYLDGAKPTIDRQHGEWIKGKEISRTMLCDKTLYIDYKDFTCSRCGLVLDRLLYNVDGSPFYKFCPNCGSDNRPRILDESVDGEGKDGNVKEGDKNE